MKCPQCGLENRANARFCRQCGHFLQEHAVQPSPAAAPGTICPACGATAKPEARFCPRCGRPLVVQPGPQPSPPIPPSPSTGSTQPSMRSIPQAATTPSEPTPYAQPPHHPPPPPAPITAERRPSRWTFWVGIVVALVCVVAIGLIVIVFGPELLGRGGEEETTPRPTPLVTASLTAEPRPLPTATPSPEPPNPTPTTEASPIPAFDAKVAIVISAAELHVGDPLTVTATLTNTGQVTLSNPVYQLVGEPTPGLEWTSQEAMRYEGDVSPGATSAVTFTLQGSQEGRASFQAYVRMDVQTAPASAESLLSEMLTVLVTPP
jgi:hypothetical protein